MYIKVKDKQGVVLLENKRTDYFRVYMATYRKENAEVVHKAQQKWRENNRAYQREYMRKYRAKKKAEQEQKLGGNENV